MEIAIYFCALVLMIVLAAVKTAQYLPGHLSDFELERQVGSGHAAAITEQKRRALLPTFVALKTVKEVVFTVVLIGLLVSTHDIWVGLVFSLLFLFVAEVLAAKGVLAGMVQRLQQKVEPRIMYHVGKAHKVVGALAPKMESTTSVHVGSKDELQKLIDASGHIVTAEEKAQLLACLTLGEQTIAGCMVPAEKIITVETKETVGPVLLDRLHKAGHKIFPVIKKDLQHVQGLLYLGDIVHGHPEVEKVADATRPAVYYVPQHAPITEVISASLKTGRQLFLVRNETDEVVGLITLADVLAKVLGTPVATETQG